VRLPAPLLLAAALALIAAGTASIAAALKSANYTLAINATRLKPGETVAVSLNHIPRSIYVAFSKRACWGLQLDIDVNGTLRYEVPDEFFGTLAGLAGRGPVAVTANGTVRLVPVALLGPPRIKIVVSCIPW